ncbi:dehydration-responsive element-binding protein 1A-like [Carex rostrata]
MESSSSNEPDYTTVLSSPPKKPSGRIKYIETRHPIYRGVRRRGTLNRWVCEVRNPKNKLSIWLGSYPTAEMAARAHDVAVMALRGRTACLNFADSARLINIPPSFSSVQEMKHVASEVAKALHSSDSSSAEHVSVSTSSVEMVDKKEASSSEMPESTMNSVSYDQTEFNSSDDLGEDMNSGLYYANMAEGLMMEPPVEEFMSNLDDDKEWGEAVSLWNW